MTFLGLPAAWLLGLAAAGAAALVGLYILRLRRRPEPVPFVILWERVLRDRDASAWYSRLQRLLSLLLQLVLLGLLVLALADPRPTATLAGGRHLVLLVDASASMQATDVPPSRLAVARERARELVRGLGPGDRVLVARLDASATPLTPFTDDLAVLERAIDGIQATDTRGDLRLGLSLALDALGDLPGAQIVLVSDGAFGDLAGATRGLDLSRAELRLVPVGSGGENLAVAAFSARRYPLDRSRVEVLLTLWNTGATEQEAEVTLLGDGAPLEQLRLRVGPGERLPRVFADLGGAHRVLEARVAPVAPGVDRLPADDRAFAVVPERRRVRVQLVTPGNTYLEAALLLDEYLDVTQVAPAAHPARGDFDVTFFDGVAPPPGPGDGALVYLGVPVEGGPVKRGRAIQSFGFDVWDEKHPVLRYLALGDVQVAQGHALLPEKGDRVLARSELGPLLVSGERGGRRFLALGFDPRDSDFVLRPAWPLFVVNAVDAFVQDDVRYVSSYRTGETWPVPVPGAAAHAFLRAPDGTERTVPVAAGLALVSGDRAGVYELTAEGAPPLRFAANLVAPEESLLAPAATLELPSARVSLGLPSLATGVRRELWGLLLAAVVLLSLLEWITYHRRWTV